MANLYFVKADIATLRPDLDEPMYEMAMSGFAFAVFLAVFAVTFQ